MVDLSRVTVVIPAHNRPARLKRLLSYYSETNIHVLVPDSSHIRFSEAGLFPNVNYIHMPDKHFLCKIYETLDLIDTPYVFYCADDDFTVPEAVASIIDFLDKNPDYNSAQGHYLTFCDKKNRIEFTPRYIRNFDKDINGSTAKERFLQLKNEYATFLYGVVRTDLFKKMYRSCMEEGKPLYRNLFLAEEYFNLFALIHGKHKTLPLFYSARERIEGSATETTIPMSEIKNQDQYRQEYANYKQILIKELAAVENLSYEEAEKEILSAINTPKVDTSITWKRKIGSFVSKHKYLRPVDSFLCYRYKQKGYKAVRGMSSYPCKFSTPEKDKIIDCILKYRTEN